MNRPLRIVVRASALLLALGACTSSESARPGGVRPNLSPDPSPAGSATLEILEAIRGLSLPNPAPQQPLTPGRGQPEPYAVRGMYGRDSSASGLDRMRAAGFNAVTVQPERAKLDVLQRAGMKGIVWLWGYDDDECAFNYSDDQIRAEIAPIAGHPAILAYQIDDEPEDARTHGCGSLVARQIRDRSRLVKSLDPGATTYLVVATYDGEEEFPYQYFAGTTDIMGLDVYPYTENGAHPELIDKAIREADKDHVPRYWAILQDFSDGYYVKPTASQLRQQFSRWRRSRMEGYFIYHWNYGDIEARQSHLDIYAAENARPVPSRS